MLKFITLAMVLFTTYSNAGTYGSLIGSPWAKEHPGKLPFEKCKLSLKALRNGPTDIFCSSDQLRLAFSLPVILSNVKKNISFKTATFEIQGRKKVSQIMGEFKVISKVKRRIILKNENQVGLEIGLDTQKSAAALPSHTSFTIALNENMSPEDCSNPYFVTQSDTEAEKQRTNCQMDIKGIQELIFE